MVRGILVKSLLPWDVYRKKVYFEDTEMLNDEEIRAYFDEEEEETVKIWAKRKEEAVIKKEKRKKKAERMR